MVHLVDVDSHELVGAWLVQIHATAPLVLKTYDVEFLVPTVTTAGERQEVHLHKRIVFKNTWDHPRTFRLISSNDTIMHIRYAFSS